MVCSRVKRVFFVYCVIQSTVDRAPRPYLYTRMRLRLWLPKVRQVNQFMLGISPSRSFFAGTQLGFKGWGKIHFQETIFLFLLFLLCMFKTIFSGHNKIREGHKKTWGSCPRMPRPVSMGLVLRTKVALTLTRVKYIAL